MLLLAFASAVFATGIPRVNTTSGIVLGHAVSNVSAFLGIPFAQPPVDNLRFKAPRRAEYDPHPRNASSFFPDCPQIGIMAPPTRYPNQSTQFDPIINAFAGGRGNRQSENCLALNIWTKQLNGSQPVLVWIHGGKFTLGSSNTPFYDGQYLADAQDIVVVTINYRLNVFGFPGMPGEGLNAGLLDQRLAVEWVRDNIAAFGGDPTKITLAGQSVGGFSVDQYAYAYAQEPLVAGLISHSGTAFSFAANTPDYSNSSFHAVAAAVNCTGNEHEVFSCMQLIDATVLLNASAKIKPAPSKAIIQPVFHPTVDNTTVFSLETYRGLSAAGKFAKVPYLAGNTDLESGYYRVSALTANISLSDAQWDLFNREAFSCATYDAVEARRKAGIPAWQFRYFGTWPNLELYPGSGAYHGSDVHMVFGGTQNLTGIADTYQESVQTAFQMMAWAKFVQDPVHGLNVTFGWPSNNTTALIRLAVNNGTFDFGNAIDYTACNGSIIEGQGGF